TASWHLRLEFCEFARPLRRATKWHAGTVVLHLKKLANLDFAFFSWADDGRDAHGPPDRFVLRLHLDDPVPADQLFGLGKGPVDHRRFSSGKLDARAFRAGLQ